MAAKTKEPNSMAYHYAADPEDSWGAVPVDILRRYFTDERGGGEAFYADATTRRPEFRDREGMLSTWRSDRQIAEVMVDIASVRSWLTVKVRGSRDFRREIWLEATSYKIGVKGYKPSERDLQEGERRREERWAARREATRKHEQETASQQAARQKRSASPLKVIDAVIRARVVDPVAQSRLLKAAGDRITDLFFEPEIGSRMAKVAGRLAKEHARGR
jgi:hypothetical protein